MVHELTKTEHDGLAVGDRVYLASDGKQRAGLRYGTLVNIWRDTPRGHFWYQVEWDGGQHHKARIVLTRQELAKLVDTRAPKPSRPTVAELQAEVAELRGQLAEANEAVEIYGKLAAENDGKLAEAQATIDKLAHVRANASKWESGKFMEAFDRILSAPSSTGGAKTTRDDEHAKYFHDGWVAALREVRLRSDRQIGEFLVEQLGETVEGGN